jgi:hypothetical protein
MSVVILLGRFRWGFEVVKDLPSCQSKLMIRNLDFLGCAETILQGLKSYCQVLFHKRQPFLTTRKHAEEFDSLYLLLALL